MGTLVGIAIIWIATVLGVAIMYTLGPPARRLLTIAAEVETAADEMRQKATDNRKVAVEELQSLDQPVDEALANYQERRRSVLPGAPDFRWGEKEIARWKRQEVHDRGRALRIRNLCALFAWNLALTATFGMGAWLYYQHIHSQVRPQVKVPNFTTSSHP